VVGALAVYDVTSSITLESIGRWLLDLRQLACPGLAIILIGNKTDLGKSREVSFEEGKSVAEREHLLFIETSAKDATNVTEAFELLTAEVVARYEERTLD
jgi:GTPase SAR1 family protein